MAFAEKDQRTKKLTGHWAVDFWFKAQGEPEKRMRRTFDSKKGAEANESYARQTGRWADPESLTQKAANKIEGLSLWLVMAGFIPAIHVLAINQQERRRWPGQARP